VKWQQVPTLNMALEAGVESKIEGEAGAGDGPEASCSGRWELFVIGGAAEAQSMTTVQSRETRGRWVSGSNDVC
jgi:hypothetical protein